MLFLTIIAVSYHLPSAITAPLPFDHAQNVALKASPEAGTLRFDITTRDWLGTGSSARTEDTRIRDYRPRVPISGMSWLAAGVLADAYSTYEGMQAGMAEANPLYFWIDGDSSYLEILLSQAVLTTALSYPFRHNKRAIRVMAGVRWVGVAWNLGQLERTQP